MSSFILYLMADWSFMGMDDVSRVQILSAGVVFVALPYA